MNINAIRFAKRLLKELDIIETFNKFAEKHDIYIKDGYIYTFLCEQWYKANGYNSAKHKDICNCQAIGKKVEPFDWDEYENWLKNNH